MQIITKAVLAVSLFTCVIVSMQAASNKPTGGGACQVVNGACVSVKCGGECGPLFPATCQCIR